MAESIVEELRKRYNFGFWNGFFRGLSAPLEMFVPQQYQVNTQTTLEALRSDWERIGGDFRAVMGAEYEEYDEADEATGDEGRTSSDP